MPSIGCWIKSAFHTNLASPFYIYYWNKLNLMVWVMLSVEDQTVLYICSYLHHPPLVFMDTSNCLIGNLAQWIHIFLILSWNYYTDNIILPWFYIDNASHFSWNFSFNFIRYCVFGNEGPNNQSTWITLR